MAIRSLQQTVDNWKASTQTGQQRYLDGVANSQVDVIGRAIAALPQAAANYQAAINSGLTARRLQAAGNQGWKDGVRNGGGAAWSAGVTAKAGKYQERMAPVLQFEAGLQQQIDAMPSGSPAANDARMLAWANGMRQAKANGAFG